MQKVKTFLFIVVCLSYCVELELLAPGFWEYVWHSDFGECVKFVALVAGLIWAGAVISVEAQDFCSKRYHNTRLSYRKRELYRKLGVFIAGDEFI